ncbi:MAG: ATP-binding protein [Sporichthyaceae bacterium]
MTDPGVEVPRHVMARVVEALRDTRVVAVMGPRQAGKSTLARQLVEQTPAAQYASLDEPAVRAIAEDDPTGFVAARPGLLAIDEIQRVPDLILAIKAEVDRDRRPGRFLITGSSRLSANRAVTETLAGRIERFTLWPFSQDELRGRRSGFLQALLSGSCPERTQSALAKRDYLDLALRGGYPEAVGRDSVGRRGAWFESYVQTVVEREAPNVTASPRIAELPRLLRLVAARQAGLLNVANLAADAALSAGVTNRHLDTLEAVFLTARIPAWSPNLVQRETRAPKIVVTDSGLAAHLRDAELDQLLRPELALGADGPIVEGFAVAEVLRLAEWSGDRIDVYHYRDRTKMEIDLILTHRGRVAALEIKAGSGHAASLPNLRELRDRLGDRFVAGAVLHTGSEGQRVGDRLWSLPLSALWEL